MQPLGSITNSTASYFQFETGSSRVEKGFSFDSHFSSKLDTDATEKDRFRAESNEQDSDDKLPSRFNKKGRHFAKEAPDSVAEWTAVDSQTPLDSAPREINDTLRNNPTTGLAQEKMRDASRAVVTQTNDEKVPSAIIAAPKTSPAQHVIQAGDEKVVSTATSETLSTHRDSEESQTPNPDVRKPVNDLALLMPRHPGKLPKWNWGPESPPVSKTDGPDTPIKIAKEFLNPGKLDPRSLKSAESSSSERNLKQHAVLQRLDDSLIFPTEEIGTSLSENSPENPILPSEVLGDALQSKTNSNNLSADRLGSGTANNVGDLTALTEDQEGSLTSTEHFFQNSNLFESLENGEQSPYQAKGNSFSEPIINSPVVSALESSTTTTDAVSVLSGDSSMSAIDQESVFEISQPAGLDALNHAKIQGREIADQLVTKLAMNQLLHLENGNRQFSVQIYPEELGQLEILVTGNQDKMAATIIASQSMASELLIREKPYLMAALNEQGINLPDVSISHRSPDEHQQSAGQQTNERAEFRSYPEAKTTSSQITTHLSAEAKRVNILA